MSCRPAAVSRMTPEVAGVMMLRPMIPLLMPMELLNTAPPAERAIAPPPVTLIGTVFIAPKVVTPEPVRVRVPPVFPLLRVAVPVAAVPLVPPTRVTVGALV